MNKSNPRLLPFLCLFMADIAISAVGPSFSETPDLTSPVDVGGLASPHPSPATAVSATPRATAVEPRQSEPSEKSRQPRGEMVPVRTILSNLADTAATKADINALVLKAIEQMPSGGGYATSSKAASNFGKAATLSEGGALRLSPKVAVPSFCSSATYLVLLKVVENLIKSDQISIDEAALRSLLYKRQPDGVGVWGRWNANGPGTARLFYELNAGDNFTDIKMALPGDFLKIWWTEEIGAKERGHLVVYLGTRRDEAGEEYLRFWSSNIPDGYGEKEVPMSKAKRVLFSRLNRPRGFEEVPKLPAKDQFLASMLTESFTMDQVKDMTGAK
jgi:hypothetical protein